MTLMYFIIFILPFEAYDVLNTKLICQSLDPGRLS